MTLMIAGSTMVDAAEKCGHDDCVEMWEAAMKKMSKKYKITEQDLGKFEQKEDDQKEKRDLAAWEKKEAIKLAKDKEYLFKEFGIVQ